MDHVIKFDAYFISDKKVRNSLFLFANMKVNIIFRKKVNNGKQLCNNML